MIQIQEHSSQIAKKVVGVFTEDIPVRAGFSALFPTDIILSSQLRYH